MHDCDAILDENLKECFFNNSSWSYRYCVLRSISGYLGMYCWLMMGLSAVGDSKASR